MNEHLNWRYTTKKFDPSKKISEEELKNLLEVLRMSPSSYGLQPWKFVIVRNPLVRSQIKSHAWGQSQVVDASHLIVFCALTKMDKEYISRYITRLAEIRSIERGSLEAYERSMHEFLKSRSLQEMSDWMKRQVYIPLGMFISECARRKVDACPMEGFNPSGVDQVLDLAQEGVTSVALCSVGYRAADDRYAGLKKVRFEPNELFIER